MLAEDKLTKGLYAIKVLKKEFIIEHDEVASTRSEKRVFQAANKELPDRDPYLLRDGLCFWRRSDVAHSARTVLGASSQVLCLPGLVSS